MDRNKLPIIIQTIVYKIENQQPMFLLLQRNEERGGFWATLNGTLEINENVAECRTRELFEETKIKQALKWNPEINRFSFDYKGTIMTVLVFSVQVDKNQKVVINEEHTAHKWLGFDDAMNLLKFDDDKKSLKLCEQAIRDKNHEE